MRWILIILLSVVSNVHAANWYVDRSATGSANGTSWANAWTNCGTIVWSGAGVVAGDTVYISGGTTSQTYTNPMLIAVSGTSGNRVTIRAGQDAGHNGQVIFDGSYWGNFCNTNMITFHNRNYITINGEFNGQNNFIFRNWFNETNKNLNFGFAIAASPANFANVFHCTVSNVNTGFYLQSATNLVVGWNKITAWGDACMALNNSRLFESQTWDCHLIFSNQMYCIYEEGTGGPDGIQGGVGMSVFNNHFETIRDDSKTNRISNHIDFWQNGDNRFNKLYNNVCLNVGDSAFSPAPFTEGYGLDSVWIYNNIFKITEEIDTVPQYIRMYNNVGLGGYTNVHIRNNLFIDRTNGTQAIYIGPEVGDAPGASNVIANNIFFNVGHPTGAIWDLEKTAGTSQSAWFITNNIYSRNPITSARVRYWGTNYTVAQWKATYDANTITNDPVFVSYVPFDAWNKFRLSAIDTVALDQGLDFSAYFTTDIEGTERSGTWDIGPYEWSNQATREPDMPPLWEPKTIQGYAVTGTNLIELYWPTNQYRIEMQVARRIYTNDPKAWLTWTSLMTNTSAGVESAGHYVDTNVTSGVTYEYRLWQLTTNYVTGGTVTNGPYYNFQYIVTGHKVPLKDASGKVVLLVESGLASSIGSELNTLTNDLIGDGWQVFRHDVAAVEVDEAGWSNAVVQTKALVMADYATDPGVDWTLFILGHVPMPYSGVNSPGSHTENLGAHPADWFYADTNATSWTDEFANDSSGTNAVQWNIPFDGKFDTNKVPTVPELRVGRVDFTGLPAFGKTEVELTQQYLARNHQWRHNLLPVYNRGVIGTNGRPHVAMDIYKSHFGPGDVAEIGNPFSVATNPLTPFLFSSSKGAGLYTWDQETGYTTNYAATPIYSVFRKMHGSYYGDYDSLTISDNVFRAPLAAEGYGLSVIYVEQVVNVDEISMGQPIGQEIFAVAANAALPSPNRHLSFGTIVAGPFTNQFTEQVNSYVSLAGDPTLRVQVVHPPTNLVVEISGSDNVLTWTASPDVSVLGYHVYRASTDMNDFTRLTSDTETSPYTDAGAAGEDYTYMVRAVKLEDSERRSFFNASQGVFAAGEAEDGSGASTFIRGNTLIRGKVLFR